MWLVATTVSAWLWISSVNLPWCVADSATVSAWLWISSVDLPWCVAGSVTVFAWLWISSVNLPWCGAGCYYSVFLALDLLGGPPLVCRWLLLQCLPGSGSPRLTSSGVWLAATTVSAWLWISSADLHWCVAGCYYSVCLLLDLLGGPPLVSG